MAEPEVETVEIIVFSQSEMEQAVTVQESNRLMKADLAGIRSEIVDNLPMDAILEAVGFDGELTPDLAREVLFEWMFGDTDPADPGTIDESAFIGRFFRDAERSTLYGDAVGQATVDI